MSALDEFLAGDRPDEVALFLSHDRLDDDGRLAAAGEPVDGGVVIVRPGEAGRRLFAAGTGMDAMEFAQRASGTEGRVARDLSGGEAPDGSGVAFAFAFAEERNPEVGGLYAEGDVIHAYAQSTDGTPFSDRWVVGREDESPDGS